MHEPATLVLADGTVFDGVSIGEVGFRVGEVVFNTAMTGYQEVLTDPSYAEQLVTFTASHIGNTGVNKNDIESSCVRASGLILSQVPTEPSNWQSQTSLGQYLKHNQMVGIADIDTRQLVRLLRQKGTQSGCLMAGHFIDIEQGLRAARHHAEGKTADLTRSIGTTKAYSWDQGTRYSRVQKVGDKTVQHDSNNYRVVVYDFGVKLSILRLLVDRGCQVCVVPARTEAKETLAMEPNGIVFSNGPGDPAACSDIIDSIRVLLREQVPLLGICLGHQLLGLAAGARTVKMKVGHHGVNHPVQDLATGRVMITSQNHGFVIDEQSLPAHIRPTHRSLFDGTLQGISFNNLDAIGFQGHPEAGPGPHEADDIFDRFVEMMRLQCSKQKSLLSI